MEKKFYRQIWNILRDATDAKGPSFEIHVVDEPDPRVFGDSMHDEPATSYVNCHFVNGDLILLQFGDPYRDQEALSLFQSLRLHRVVWPVRVFGLPLAGGVIHCATQPVLASGDF